MGCRLSKQELYFYIYANKQINKYFGILSSDLINHVRYCLFILFIKPEVKPHYIFTVVNSGAGNII